MGKGEDFRIRRQLDAGVRAAKENQSRARAEARNALEDVVASGGISARAWDDPKWQTATPPEQAGGDIRIGRFVVDLPAQASGLEAPAALHFPFEAGLFIDGAADNHRLMVDLARSICLRTLAAVPAGKLQFTFIDPVAYGQSVADFQHLADFDKQLVGIKPVTSGREIEERLAGLSAHMETVISDYLRGQFATIDEYNAVAGEVAEPYRVLVVFDYPAGFSDGAAQRLLSLAENGPRCGIHVITVNDRSRAQPRDLPLDRLRLGQHRITVTGTPADPRITLHTAGPDGINQREIVPDAAPSIEFDRDGTPQSRAAELLVKVGTLARDAGNAPVTLPRLLPVLNQVVASGRSTGLPPVSPAVAISEADPSTWWRGSTAQNAVAPLGLSGARDVAAMFFSSTDVAGGAIMVGLPSSGKTTSLHSAILTMCMMYGPEELELYLIDAKHGVEFKVYERLPHARMVSINSDRELAVAVLKSLDREIQRRAGLMKSRAAGRANITEYRQVTGERMSRIVLIMDEFHEIFEEDDHLGREAFQAFSNLVRQGRFAGIHVVVASQTLSSMPALDRPTLQLLPQRVAFMCNETDADIVMGDANPGARLLTRQGRGLFNPVRGEVSHNRHFQGMYIPPNDRDDLIGALAATAASAGWGRLPRVFDGDVAAPRPAGTAAQPGATRLTIPVGEPFTLDLAVSLELRRTRTANVILLGDMDDETLDPAIRGALHSCVLAALTAGAGVSVIDYIGDERVAGGLTIMNLARLAGLPYSRSKGAAQILRGLTRLVSERLAAEDYTGQGHVLIVFGLQRALSLRPVDPYQLDDPEAMGDAVTLTRLLQDGPEAGVHVIIACDSVKAVERRLGRDVLEEFAFRVAGSAAGAADLSYVAETFGDIPGLRHSQLLVGDQSANRTTRVRGYPLLTQEDIPSGGPDHE